MAELLMPRLSDSMEEGTIVRWLIADGTAVERGQEVVEIETDKATMGYEASDGGTLRILAAEGDTLPVGAPIATIGDEAGPPPVAPRTETVEAPVVTPAAPVAGRAEGGRGTRLSASPVARRAAVALGVDLAEVSGSGAYGRIYKADVEAFAANGNGAGAGAGAPQAPAGGAAETARGGIEVVELSRVQSTIARRMAESRATIPEFSLTVEVEMDSALALRRRIAADGEHPPSLNDMIVAACGRALRRHPRANGCYVDGRFELYQRINVGIAVAAEDSLLVPTIFDADATPLGEIAARSRRLAQRARAGEIAPPELAGGTFTVSNLGMFGVRHFTGVINPGQAAILCVGTIVSRPAFDADGAVVARETMSMTLVSDHRILYGADAAAFLADLRETLERPHALLV